MSLRRHRDKLRKIEQATYLDQQLLEAKSTLAQAGFWIRRQFLGYYFTTPPLWKVVWRASLRRERMTPAFASLGAVRSGTSSLADYIMQHPNVALPLAKEIGLATMPRRDLIMAQFPSKREQARLEREIGGGRAITGYCAPVVPYLAFPFFASTIMPREGARFIIILRNPVDRTFAHWRWDSVLFDRVMKDPLWRRYPDFGGAVRLELESLRAGGGGLKTVSGPSGGGYIQHSIYLPFLKNLFRFYDKADALFIQAEDFFDNPLATAKAVYRFLDLPDFEPIPTPVKNAGPSATMDDATRRLLRDFFAPLNEDLYRFIGREFSWA